MKLQASASERRALTGEIYSIASEPQITDGNEHTLLKIKLKYFEK